MSKRLRGTLVAVALCLVPIRASAQTVASASPANAPPPPDTRLVPAHAQICDNGIVNKHKLFVQMATNANPALSIGLLTSVNWRTIVTSKNVCSAAKACSPTDPSAIIALKYEYDLFLGFSDGYYTASNPNLTVEQYFGGPDNANPIKCTAKDEPPAAAAPTSPLDAKSQLRIRGISDDLSIAQSDPAFAKSSSATVSYTQNNVTPQTQTTAITGAVGYDLLPDGSTAGSLVPYLASNISVTDTKLKPRTKPATNFVAGGVLYSSYFYIPNSNVENKITLKGQQVDGTTMDSELTTFQAIYAPYTNPIGILPALNSVVGFPVPEGMVPNYFGQVIFDVRADLGHYEDRGLPAFLAQNQNYERFGSKFGYAFIGNPTNLPSFSLSVTETALYGANGGPRNLSYFDSLLQIYFDPKKYFSASLEYINGRDENTYVLSHQYKAGLAAHY